MIYTGPVWDFDIAFDNVGGHYPVCNKKDFVCFDGGSHAGNMRLFAQRILQDDPQTINELRAIWGEARKNGITGEELQAWIAEQAMLIYQSQRFNFMRWDILNSIEHGNPVARGSFGAEVDYLKKYIGDRVEWMDKKLGYVHTDVENTTVNDNLIRIWDVLGRAIYEGQNMPQLEAGTYIIRQNGETNTQIIVQL